MAFMSILSQAPTFEPATFVDILRWRAHNHPDRLAYTFLVDGETEEIRLTYQQLDERARAIAARLQALGATGGRALLLYPSGLDYIAAFFGCLYAGVVAVPAYPPRRNRSLDRINAIVSDANATVVLTTDSIFADIERRFAEEPLLEGMHWLSTDHVDSSDAITWKEGKISGDTLAFLQYTSGSTGTPKGVMISHDNLIYNERMIRQGFQMREDCRVLGWLPLYHDMGLIGLVLQPLFVGAECVLMAPVSFLQKPARWLQAMSRYQATTSGGPNFAYDLCVRKITAEQQAELDLKAWEVAFNGAEPIRPETLDRFVSTFGPYGFRKEAFYPCYGLAEATLFVTGGLKTAPHVINTVDGEALERNEVVSLNGSPGPGRALVSCGRTWLDQKVKIIDPESLEPCGPDKVGEIWISGPSVARGYWNKPAETSHTFEAKYLGNGTDPSLRTGDLGFLHDGNLFVTGRLKDLIIIRGRNHYPQDIEHTVGECHPALNEGLGAAFSITVDGEEKLAIAYEVKRSALRDLDVDDIVTAIRKAVSERHELQTHSVALLKTGSIPKTTSGKIKRRACKRGFLDNSLAIVGESTVEVVEAEEAEDNFARVALMALPPAERQPLITKRLQQLVAKALKVSPSKVAPSEPLSSLGLDSLDVIELKLEIETNLGVTVPMDEGLDDLTIHQLTGKVAQQLVPDAEATSTESSETNENIALDIFEKCDGDGGYFGARRVEKDHYFTQPVLEGQPGPRMKFQGKDVIVWSVNNYLGLVGHEGVQASARQSLEEFGTWTPMGSRMLTGNSHRHIALEQRLASYLQKESSIVFNYGYMGVMGTIAALTGGADTVLIDSLSHACIVDGAVVASAGRPFRIFRHNDMNSLEEQLKAINRNRRGGVLIVTEGVFGMSGDLAPLDEICRLKDRYGARLFVDDAHGFGVMGETGAGTGEHLGVQDQIDLYFGTFAKSFAAIGGVTAGDEKVVDYIRFNARTNIFAKSLPMVYVDAVGEALDIIKDETERRDQMWHIAHRLQQGFVEMGFDIGNTQSPITPVYVPTGDLETAMAAIRMLRDELGVFVSAVTYPVVPKGIVLFRITATAAHTDEDVDITLNAFKTLRDRLNLPLTKSSGD